MWQFQAGPCTWVSCGINVLYWGGKDELQFNSPKSPQKAYADTARLTHIKPRICSLQGSDLDLSSHGVPMSMQEVKLVWVSLDGP